MPRQPKSKTGVRRQITAVRKRYRDGFHIPTRNRRRERRLHDVDAVRPAAEARDRLHPRHVGRAVEVLVAAESVVVAERGVREIQIQEDSVDAAFGVGEG